MKLPAFQFYPGDWRKDSGVQSLDFEARGVWFEMLCLMHESTPRGVLMLNGKAMHEIALSRLLGIELVLLKQITTKLIEHGVASVEPNTGAIMSRRMVRDEALRKTRAECGKQGGNPRLLKQNPTTGDKQNPTPSSSVSSSSSASTVQRAQVGHLPESLQTAAMEEAWGRWLVHWSSSFANGRPMPEQTAHMQLRELVAIGPIRAIAAIENSISKGGLRKPAEPFDTGKNNANNRTGNSRSFSQSQSYAGLTDKG